MIKSIISSDYKCYLCGKTCNLEIHHIMSNANRDKSTKYGLVVYLCKDCHRGANGVHANYEKMQKLREIAQERFIINYPALDWLSIFHRNYLSEERIEELKHDRTKNQ